MGRFSVYLYRFQPSLGLDRGAAPRAFALASALSAGRRADARATAEGLSRTLLDQLRNPSKYRFSCSPTKIPEEPHLVVRSSVPGPNC